ncbi:Stk1 family PASTA domain-containing Ser/Thr kinase [Conexibacter sp. JD483]|uniref:Stk1 family PASTA domain-containing Ser/Thr kinase n=1 Tax=unclassified Conexibacter TaxID=2627773 RepID=UPI00271A40F0|nr:MULTISPECIES: Stk1 family PASTA domain-containing Ser/Thr kinase [unclassified Conexibacter]MDO8184463.1 Stk1 family PASTA domain-containing Ser/Thr kinase [Conexibacter sp. CPCC 205706]MDO8197769.1 Stk1 family PASTA domain-containing Ser/Thr kinase [Conexibacter sp. CPCC 205762]MDR9368095.1 Stk1 family PASTA domain-containing Ser/Thr kinase [Conexibacter sp. JD483]
MTEIAPDTIIDQRYKVLSRIGAGGMAEVFVAQDQSLGRKVALKLLYPRFANDAEFVERFRREASSAASLQHPNVVGIYDRGRWDGTYYIAMEYMPGRTLKQVILQDSPIDPVRAIDLTVQVLKAARFAHRRGIVHRDLKPHNVIVDDEDRAKVTDFGIARAGASDMTETGSIMGTAQYLSPEQAQGQAVSPQSDLYSVGVILFELLTGHVPFDAESAVTIALKHVSEPAPPPSAFDPAVPPELDAITLWALEKEPARRPQDADAFIHALEETRESILGRENPGQRTASFPAAAVLAAEGPPTTEEAVWEEQPQRRRRVPWWGWVLALLAIGGVAAAIVLLTQTKQVTVPGVVGLQLQTAQDRLERAQLRSRIETVKSTRPVNEVVAQTPAGRRRVDEQSVVVLSVSGGPGTVEVPAVDGGTVEEAKLKLANAGLKAGRTIEQASDSVPSGTVIKSSPAAGDDITPGNSVNLYVSTGPAQVSVPNVVGYAQADAESTLSDAGFRTTVSEQESSTARVGAVISQDPGGNTKADPGATIALVVARAPAVTIPNVVGSSEQDATAALEARGLEPRVSRQAVDDPAQDGIVLSQRPGGDTQTTSGRPVRIVVGRYTEPTPPDNGGGGDSGGGDGTTTTPGAEQPGRSEFGRGQGGGADDSSGGAGQG